MKATQRKNLPVAETMTDSATREMFLVRRCLQDIGVTDNTESTALNRGIAQIITDFDQRFIP